MNTDDTESTDKVSSDGIEERSIDNSGGNSRTSAVVSSLTIDVDPTLFLGVQDRNLRLLEKAFESISLVARDRELRIE